MSKYDKEIFLILAKELKSTNEILAELQTKAKKKINWYLVYHALTELEHEGKAEKQELKAGMFWKKK